MNLRRAALLAAIGVLLRGGFFFISNLIPSWGASDSSARLALLMTAIIAPLAWAAFFVAIRREGVRIAAITAAIVSMLELAILVRGQYPTFGPLSLDTAIFMLGTLVPALCWLMLLLRFAGFAVSFRSASVYLVLECLVQFGFVTYEFLDSIGQLGTFWNTERQLITRLVTTPLIWMFYWATQALFLRWAQKA